MQTDFAFFHLHFAFCIHKLIPSRGYIPPKKAMEIISFRFRHPDRCGIALLHQHPGERDPEG